MASTFFDTPDTFIGTAGTILSGSGADRANFEGGVFYSTDFVGGEGAVDATISGNANVGLATSSDPGPYGQTLLRLYPGTMQAMSSAVGSTAYAQVGAISQGHSAIQWYVVYPGCPTTTFRTVFLTPLAASNAAERYITRIGPAYMGVNTTAPLPSGWYIEHTDTANGGNWVFVETSSSAITTTVNTSIPLVPNTAHELVTVVTGDTNVLMTLRALNSTTANVVFNGLSPRLAIGPMPIYIASTQVYRVTLTVANTIRGCLLDYTSLTVAASGRQW